MVFHFYSTCLNSFNISSLYCGGIIMLSTSVKFSSETGFCFTVLSAILFPIKSPVVSAAFWTTFLESLFRASSLF